MLRTERSVCEIRVFSAGLAHVRMDAALIQNLDELSTASAGLRRPASQKLSSQYPPSLAPGVTEYTLFECGISHVSRKFSPPVYIFCGDWLISLARDLLGGARAAMA
jgi:hypothetical protein